MGAMFGGGGSVANNAYVAPVVQAAPAAPRGPQLAPGQRTPGGPIMPAETEDERQRRLLAARADMTILGDADWGQLGGGATGGGEGSGADGGGGGAGSAGAGAGDGSGSASP